MSLLGPVALAGSLILAVVFLVAGIAKFADRAGTLTAVREFGAPAVIARPLALFLPLAELIVAALLVPVGTRAFGSLGALALLLLFSGAIAYRLSKGAAPDCHCFGQLHSAPVSWKTLARNGVLALLAAISLTAALAGNAPSAFGWIGALSATGIVILILAVTSVALAVGGVMALLSLLRSHGRVLLRVDELERRLQEAGLGEIPEQVAPGLGRAPGESAPTFVGTDTNRSEVSLTDLLAPGLPLLLLFTSPSCGACKILLPKVATWQDQHSDVLTIAIANGGDRAASLAEAKEHRLERVFGDPDLAVFEAYRASGTPSAVLVAADGTIASYVAAGAGSIESLLSSALAGQGKTAEGKLHVGSPAPAVTASTIDGQSLDLASVRENTLIVFWNPGCGYCSAMREDLLAWEKRTPAGAPKLLIVSSGDESSTRAEGFSSNVALDPEFSIAGAFDANGTPMAILIDSEGRVASSLAAGAEALFTLAGGRAPIDSLGNTLGVAPTR